jgi:hypothetical protein
MGVAMGYTRKDWTARIHARSDLSAYLTHLTRTAVVEGKYLPAIDRLLRILRMRRLVGSTTSSGFIVGTRPAVCFFDAPLHSIIQNWLHDHRINPTNSRSFAPYGLSFSKPYLYRLGARPVIYDQTDDAKAYLPANQYWRIVPFDLTDDGKFIDWTHEREWRIPRNLDFDISEAIVLVQDGKAQRELLTKAAAEGENVAALVKAIVPLDSAIL